jgi:hypothetical protein
MIQSHPQGRIVSLPLHFAPLSNAQFASRICFFVIPPPSNLSIQLTFYRWNHRILFPFIFSNSCRRCDFDFLSSSPDLGNLKPERLWCFFYATGANESRSRVPPRLFLGSSLWTASTLVEQLKHSYVSVLPLIKDLQPYLFTIMSAFASSVYSSTYSNRCIV